MFLNITADVYFAMTLRRDSELGQIETGQLTV